MNTFNSILTPVATRRSLFRIVTDSGLALLFAVLISQLTASAYGQSRPLPSADYYQLPFVNYYQGNYRQAIRNFTSLERTAFKAGTQRWLDSICYWTMIGECHYQVGNYSQAVQFYDQSIALYLSYVNEDWQSRIQNIPVIAADNNALNRARITWGNSGRRFIVPRMPTSMGVLFGDMDAEARMQLGGVMRNPEVRSADLNEIMRCTALAIYRRNQILGPTSKFSAMSNRMVAVLKAGRGQPGLFGAYNGVLLGLALASVDDWDGAVARLGASLQFNNGMDHGLTPLALLQLAQIGMATQQYATVTQFASEASYSGAIFSQFDVIDDALTLGNQVHLMQTKTPFPPLPLAIEWARRERAHRMQTSLAVRLAESFSELGQTAEAGVALAQTNNINARDTLATNQMGGRVKFIQALTLFQGGNFNAGMTELDAAIKLYRPSSLWIYRLAQTEALTATGSIGERQSDLLYGSLLRDPNEHDWQLDPLEALTFLTTDHLAPLERWFEVTILRGDYERALEIAELTRRHRFFSQTPFGGRTMAFRWLLHSPRETLSSVAQQQRRDFLIQYPQYQEWINRTDQIHTALSLLPLLPDANSEHAREQGKLFDELAAISQRQEAFLANCGLRRIPAEMVFPPQHPMSDFRTRLADDQVAWVGFATGRGYHRFLVRSNMVQYLGMLKDRDVQRPIADVMKKLGVSETAVDVSLLAGTDWKDAVKTAAEKLLAGVTLDELVKFRELVIVPDGLIWYFPFEAIEVTQNETTVPLVDKMEIRYSPTLFLAYDGQRPIRELKNKAVVYAKLHPKAESLASQSAFNELVAEMPEAVKLESLPKRTQPELLKTLIDQLLVWNEVQLGRSSGLELAPIDLPQVTSTPLRLWLLLPWRTPEHVVFPAFQSDAGTGFRGRQKGADLFMATLGLMGSGTRSILISRWRTGGANSLALSRNYFQRIGKMSTAQAHRESIVAAKGLTLNYAVEPQVRTKRNDPELKAEHPYFWAGYMRLEIPLVQVNDEPEAPPEDLGDDPMPEEAKNEADPKMNDEADGMNADGAKGDGAKGDGAKGDGAKGDGAKGDGAKGDGAKGEKTGNVRSQGSRSTAKAFRASHEFV